jgi:group I intron endonuclease
MAGSIYLITNKLNGNVYVGKTMVSPHVRWLHHNTMARHGSQAPVHAAIRKYGADSFSLTVVDEAETSRSLNAKERRYIKMFKREGRSYNATLGGDGVLGAVRSVESCLKASLALSGAGAQPKTHGHARPSARKPVVGVSLLDGREVRYEFSRQAQADGFSASKVTECCLGRRKVHRGFQWRYA